MLSTSPTAAKTGLPAEEWAIHDYEGFENITLSENEGLEEVCALAEAIDEHGEAFAAFWNYQASGVSIEDAVNSFQEAYQGTFVTLEEWAEDYAEDTGLLDSMPESLRYYFDFERFARDCSINGDIVEMSVSDGVAVFNQW